MIISQICILSNAKQHTNRFAVWRDYQFQPLSGFSNIHILHIPIRGILPN